MDIERKPISSLIGKEIGNILDAPRNHVYFLDNRGQILFSVNRDDLFDADGNRLEDDI